MVVEREPARDSLIDVLDRVLEKGIVIDASVRISVAGIELVGIDARVVVASVETYLRHADALAFTALASPGRRDVSQSRGDRMGERQSDRRVAARRGARDRRVGSGRRVRNRRVMDLLVPVERRSQPDRRAGGRRRQRGRRGVAPDRRSGLDRRGEA